MGWEITQDRLLRCETEQCKGGILLVDIENKIKAPKFVFIKPTG